MTNADGNKGMERGIKNMNSYPIIPLKLTKKLWEEEFEDNIVVGCNKKFEATIQLKNKDILYIINKYLKDNPIKIKCKNGCIQIERKD